MSMWYIECGVRMHACGSQKRTLNVLFYHSLSYSPETESLTEPGIRLTANKPHQLVLLSLPVTALGYRTGLCRC